MTPRAALFTTLLLFGLMSTASAATRLGLDLDAVRSTEGRVEIPISLGPLAEADVAALQFDVRFDDSAWRYADAQPGDSATAAGKSVHGHRPQGGALRVIVAGFNQNAMAPGPVAVLTFSPVPGVLQPLNISLYNAILSDPFGNPLPVELDTPALQFDPAQAVAVATEGTAPAGGGNSFTALARYRALIFAAVLVAGMMFVSRRIPRKGRLR